VRTHQELLRDPELHDPDATPDYTNGISSKVVRCRYKGMRAVAVGGDLSAKTQIAALVDLLDLHLSTPAKHRDGDVAPDRVALLLGGRPAGSAEAVDAVRTMTSAQVDGPEVEVYEHDDKGGWAPITDVPVDLAKLAQDSGYDRLLDAVPHQPPQLVVDLLHAVGHDALRAYPMLSSRGRTWSIRLEGLQIGVVSVSSGWLSVGSPGKLGGPARLWQATTGLTSRMQLTSAQIPAAAAAVSSFASRWLAPSTQAASEQDEHALESRILRGHVSVPVDGQELQLLRPHATVNWGSQFPTRWGRDGRARYLDGLLRDGRTPWALEMKVQGGAGVGQYYRHAVVQAVLYRQFIRGATPLHRWFESQDLEATACRAAVVVPQLPAGSQQWRIRLQRLCALFDVALVEVPASAAQIAHLPAPPAASTPGTASSAAPLPAEARETAALVPAAAAAQDCPSPGLPSVAMTYMTQERARASAWKRTTTSLPEQAKAPAPYVGKDGAADGPEHDFCLPPSFADLSLLPGARATALAVFADLGIPWHAGVGRWPSNHLLSSQVQCANALAAAVTDPQRLVRAFGAALGVQKVLPIEGGRFLTFEYIGPRDYFGESPSGDRVRGAHSTSIDAAFLHQAADGAVELVLLEWKYTESYRPRRPDPAKDAVRRQRYEAAVLEPDGPVRAHLLAFEHLLDEPFYQLVRQQLLAHALEQDHAEGASRVRVVHLLPAGNLAYQQSLARPEHRAVGDTVSEVWSRLLRKPERFTSLDTVLFEDPSVTSREYALRYGQRTVYDEPDLLRLLGTAEPDGVEDVLDFEGAVSLSDEGVELLVGRVGTLLPYPFLIDELQALADELEQEEAEPS
jgi:hypothetical protein